VLTELKTVQTLATGLKRPRGFGHDENYDDMSNEMGAKRWCSDNAVQSKKESAVEVRELPLSI
jgi:hypothetical protein